MFQIYDDQFIFDQNEVFQFRVVRDDTMLLERQEGVFSHLLHFINRQVRDIVQAHAVDIRQKQGPLSFDLYFTVTDRYYITQQSFKQPVRGPFVVELLIPAPFLLLQDQPFREEEAG